MKFIYVACISFILLNLLCCNSLDKNYSGYLLFKKKPLIRVKVIEKTFGNYTYTDKEGFFTLRRSNLNYVDNLIIQSIGSDINDTIQLLREGGTAGSRYYLFVSRNNDSLDIHRERYFENHTRNSYYDDENYSGYLFYFKKPMVNKKIMEVNTENYTFTDKNGFFCFKRGYLDRVNNLIV